MSYFKRLGTWSTWLVLQYISRLRFEDPLTPSNFYRCLMTVILDLRERGGELGYTESLRELVILHYFNCTLKVRIRRSPERRRWVRQKFMTVVQIFGLDRRNSYSLVHLSLQVGGVWLRGSYTRSGRLWHLGSSTTVSCVVWCLGSGTTVSCVVTRLYTIKFSESKPTK